MKKGKWIASLLFGMLVAACTVAVPSASLPDAPTLTPQPVPATIPPLVENTVPSEEDNDLSPTQMILPPGTAKIVPGQDIRFEDVQQYGDLGEALIQTLWFNSFTNWTDKDREIAQKILRLGMNPGLGVRDLHRKGITGQGVSVAIIDQPMNVEHPEFRGKIAKYSVLETEASLGVISMHGPAVTSLLVGENIGVAPDAVVYYVAVPSWLRDAQYYADALEWIIHENETLPEGKKIRVVSVSAAPSGAWSSFANMEVWDAAYQRATQADILVLDWTLEHGYTNVCSYDLNNPDDPEKCIPLFAGPGDTPHKRVHIPTNRTTAAEDERAANTFTYQYTGMGGGSWTIPYLAGVLAMGWQINPALSPLQILDILFASGAVGENGARIVNPEAFVEAVQNTLP